MGGPPRAALPALPDATQLSKVFSWLPVAGIQLYRGFAPADSSET